MFVFAVEPDPAAARLRELSALAPANPFCTPEYVAFRKSQGERALLFLLCAEDRIVDGCTAFVRAGRLNQALELPSRPAFVQLPATAAEVFWSGLRAFCAEAGVTRAEICSFAARAGAIPAFAEETARKRRWEYVVELHSPQALVGMRKGHAYEVKRARQAGLQLRRTRDPQACAQHVVLMNESMLRRRERGEAVTAVEYNATYRSLLESAAGELFQVVQGEEVVSSNMFLLAPRGAYNHTQGTSPAGMKCGAAHFLLHEAASSLAAEGRTTFNLGGTDQAGSGLEKFKTGFSSATERVELEAASLQFAGRAAAVWFAAKRLLLQR
jgi:hypothetical protein